jgi:hypothetical protein
MDILKDQRTLEVCACITSIPSNLMPVVFQVWVGAVQAYKPSMIVFMEKIQNKECPIQVRIHMLHIG